MTKHTMDVGCKESHDLMGSMCVQSEQEQEKEANWLYTTLSVSRDKFVSHQLRITDNFSPGS